jgi:hypothetical protein
MDFRPKHAGCRLDRQAALLFLRCRIQSYDELIAFIPFWPRLSMMLSMINASGICPIGNGTRACAAAMATLQSSPAKH